jgi:hypothetical protein
LIDDPNVVLPLATTYNERGVAGYTHAITNSEDQRKLNCFYEVSKNPMTGKGTLTLSKRPGVTDRNLSLGAATQVPYSVIEKIESASPIIINKAGGTIRSSSVIGNINIKSDTGETFIPTYVDITSISNVFYAVLQVNGNLGSDFTYFNSDTSLGANTAWTQISNASFVSIGPIGKMEHLDGFALQMSTKNLIYNSDSNSLANWSVGTGFIAKQIKQDVAIGLARLSNKILAFGNETVEGFYNAGNTVGSPLGRIPQLHARIGMVSNNNSYYTIIADKLYFVGRLASISSGCGLFVFDGYNFIKISGGYIDKILSQKETSLHSVCSVIVNARQMVAIQFGPLSGSTVALLYSPEWKEWFEWTSDVFQMVNGGVYFLGLPSGTNGQKLYSFLTTDNYQDAGTSYQWLTQFRLPTNGSTKKSMLMYGVDADTDTSANLVSVEVSDDDCQSFYSLQPIDLTWERKVNFRGGSYTRRHIRLSATDARPKRIANFIANVSG